MSIERDKDFEQLEDIAAMMTENPCIEFENGKYVYYGLDGRTAFAAVYIGGAWSAWQAKAQAVPEGYILIPKKMPDDVNDHLWDFMTDNFVCTNDYGDSFMACDDFNLDKFYAELVKAQELNQPTQFNLDEFLIMEEKLKSKGGVIAADLDRFIAYAEMVLGKAKAQAVPDTYTPTVLALEDVQSKITKASFLTMDAENESEVYAVDANELTVYIDELIKSQEAK